MKKIFKKIVNFTKKFPIALGHLIKDLSLLSGLLLFAYVSITGDFSIVGYIALGLVAVGILMSLISFKGNISTRKSIMFLEAIDNREKQSKKEIKSAIKSVKAGERKDAYGETIADTIN